MNCSGRTFANAFATHLALVEIDVCEIVLNRNGLERTSLSTFSTAYAGCLAGFLGHCALVLVDTTYIDPPVFRTFVAKLYDALRTSLGTSAASSTFVLVHNRKSGCRIH